MKIIHRVALASSAKIIKDLSKLGLDSGKDFISFDISECDDRWHDVERIIEKYNASDITTTKFSAKEKKDANFLSMMPSWHHGYPEPAKDNFYLDSTYDTTSYCSECGIGLVQEKPFYLKKEPVWGKKNILQINWIFDEFFVVPSIYEKIFKPLGIDTLPVKCISTDQKLETVVQLKITKCIDFNMKDRDLSTCVNCGTAKYLPVTRGFFPSIASDLNENVHIAKTFDYFGSGSNAYKEVIVSNYLYQKIIDEKVRGVDFIPIGKT